MFKFIKPEFFDIFGVAVFGFIITISYQALNNGHLISRWALVALLVVGILGLIVDGTIVFMTYIKKKK